MTARPEVVALLTDFDVERAGARQRFVRRDGRPFTAEVTGLTVSTADEDMRAAAGQLAAAPQRLTELIAAYIRAVAEDTGDRRPPAEATMSPGSGGQPKTGAQTVTVRTASGRELAYPRGTSVRVDRQGDLRVLQGLRQRAFHPCAEWAGYTVTNLRCGPEAP